jgi:Rho guanine nucleotide exchange factor 10
VILLPLLQELSVEGTRRILNTIQSSIQQKDEEMAWVDSCCLQLAVKSKSNKEEIYTFQTDNPAVKKEWITGNDIASCCGLRLQNLKKGK